MWNIMSIKSSILDRIIRKALCVSLVLFLILKATLGIRVDEEEEMGGLDVGEHGMLAYGDFETKSGI